MTKSTAIQATQRSNSPFYAYITVPRTQVIWRWLRYFLTERCNPEA